MVADRAADIRRGMQLVPQLPEIMPDQASGQLRRVYEEVRNTLRVPFVNFIFRVLANHETYLAPEWDQLRPWARTLGFERDADAIRGAALHDPLPLFTQGEWPALGDLDRIRPFTESIHYVLPKLLLLATAMDERLNEQRSDTCQRSSTEFGADGELPYGIAAGTQSIPMTSPDTADPMLRGLFDRIRTRHAHPGVATYYRALGHWPAFLQAVWERIDPHVGTSAYEERRQVAIQQAVAALLAKPPRRASDARSGSSQLLPEDVISDLRATLAVFRFRVIPDLLIDVSFIRAMLEGPDAARQVRFSAA